MDSLEKLIRDLREVTRCGYESLQEVYIHHQKQGMDGCRLLTYL